MPGILFIIATPIGNLEDITQRALRVLNEVDTIICEDTRVSGKLLQAYSIKKPTISIHAHSQTAQFDRVLDLLQQGKNLAYLSDAGTPNMNDPGGLLVEKCFEQGITVQPIPGVSVLTAAISICGFPMEHFSYRGFIPHKKGRETLLKEICASTDPTVFLESTHRIEKMLEQLNKAIDKKRLIFIGRELTKLHETLYRGTIDEVTQQLQATSTKGEFIIIIGPSPKKNSQKNASDE